MRKSPEYNTENKSHSESFLSYEENDNLVDLKEFKKALGKEVDYLTEEQILKLREQQDQEAEIYINMWIESIINNKSKI